MSSKPALLCASGVTAILFVASRSLAAGGTEAGAGPDLRIESMSCSHALVDEVQHLTRVELSNVRLPPSHEQRRAVLSCAGRSVMIRAVLGDGDTRQLDLEQTDEALRGRIVALALAELVRDTASGAAAPKPTPEADPTVAEPPLVPSSRPSEPPLREAPPGSRLVLFGKLSNYGGSFEPLYGGGFGFSRDVGRFALGVSPSVAISSRDVSVGSVQLLAADLSLRASLRFPSDMAPGELGIGHAIGVARIEGTSSEPSIEPARVSGVWAAPFAFASVEPKLSDTSFLQLGAQLGVVTLPVRGRVERGSDSAVAGLWVQLALGIGLNL